MGDKTESRISNEERLNSDPAKDESKSDAQQIPSQKESKCPAPEKVIKIFFVSLLFIIVLGSGYVSRITLHILIWHIQPPVYSEVTINRLGGLLKSNCSTCIPSGHSISKCPSEIDTGAVDKTWIWALFLVIITPYVLTFVSTTARIIFKSNLPIEKSVLVKALLIETAHSIGLSMLAFLVLPSLDPASASVLYMAVAVLLPVLEIWDWLIQVKEREKIQVEPQPTPAIETEDGLGGKMKQEQSICNKATMESIACSFAGIALQIASIICISIFINIGWFVAVFVLGVVLTSVKYWMNFVKFGGEKSDFFRQLKRKLQLRPTKIACITSLWKIIVTFLAVITIFTSRASSSTKGFLALFTDEAITLSTLFGSQNLGENGLCRKTAPFVVATVNIVCSLFCYKAAKVVCVIHCQRFGFTIPLLVLPLATTGTLVGVMHKPIILHFQSCDLFFSDWCIKGEGNLIQDDTLLFVAFVALIVSILFITRHVWKTNGYRHGETARIFVSHFYCGLFLDLSLLLNRRREDGEYDIVKKKIPEEKERIKIKKRKRKEKKKKKKKEPKERKKEKDIKEKKQKQPILYACAATMWHETANEMTQLLKSIFRLDKLQWINKNMAKKNHKDVETFDLEAHVFFDDAFDPIKTGEEYPDVNQYVKTFIEKVHEMGKIVHKMEIKTKEGTGIITPYGLKIIWKLPGDNSLVVHLKDKNKIRHKKRWSQIMYMHYILEYELEANFKKKDLKEVAENTYILALDGDVDFEPEAVMSLMRRMEKSKTVGAACGRIHPIGPMVWYQVFEYAISHWFQKATEHVIGCVLCSPGCFSLFRGSAILNHDVLETYSTVATEAQHFVQYDQGEDRWLCTLLLKQGWRVEYCAEADANTFAPEGFYEFYNQRRRWTPSTMANILDLIVHWKKVTKNENISLLYIVYHVFLFLSTLLTPGTVFMIIFGAIIVGFDSIPPWLSLILNLIPVALFMLMTLYASAQRQLQYAAILSCIYVIVMVIVLIGVIRDAAVEGICSASTILVLYVAGMFIIAAIFHPKEFLCLLPGLLYFLAIPSMSMLMFMYSIGNLHVVSWGTRETTPEQTESNKGELKGKAEEKGNSFSLGKFFNCVCMFGGSTYNNYKKEDLLNQNMLNQVEEGVKPEETKEASNNHKKKRNSHRVDQKHFQDSDGNSTKEERKIEKGGNKLEPEEQRFWENCIEKYLKPIKEDEKTKERIEKELINLRNRVSLFVFLLNAILVTVMFWLTQVDAFSDTLSIFIECGEHRKLKIVPVAFLFSFVFGILLLIQFFGMFYHRFSTLIHICSSTHIIENTKTKDKMFERKMLDVLLEGLPEAEQDSKDITADKDRKQPDWDRTIKPDYQKTYSRLDDIAQNHAYQNKGKFGSKEMEFAQRYVDKYRRKQKIIDEDEEQVTPSTSGINN